MKNIKFSFCLIILTGFYISSVHAHGLGSSTLVKSASTGWWPIEQVCRFACQKKEQYVASYNVDTKNWVGRPVTCGGVSQANCYFVIGFSENKCGEVVCTPTQEFYLPHKHMWVPAYQLHVDDVLLGQNNYVPITYITFVKKPLEVYSLAVKDTHTFAVGQHAVLTHNMILPMALSAGLSIPFGAAAAGGTIGGCFGPATLVGGIVLGGIIGIVSKTIAQGKMPRYELSFNVGDIELYHKKSNEKESDSSSNKISGSGGGNFQDPDDKRKKNNMNKSEFFKQDTIKKDYEHYRDGIYKKKKGTLGIEGAEYLQWDHLHNDVEAYSKNERHLGSIDPHTLEFYKDAVFARKFPLN